MTYDRFDTKQRKAPKEMLGTIWLHTGNNKLYRICGFVWNCEDDTWMIKYIPYFADEDEAVEFVRTIEGFNGQREGKPRFIKVSEDQ